MQLPRLLICWGIAAAGLASRTVAQEVVNCAESLDPVQKSAYLAEVTEVEQLLREVAPNSTQLVQWSRLLSRPTWRGIWLAERLIGDAAQQPVVADLHRYSTPEDVRTLLDFPDEDVLARANVDSAALAACFNSRAVALAEGLPLPLLRVTTVPISAQPPAAPIATADLASGVAVDVEFEAQLADGRDDVTMSVELSAQIGDSTGPPMQIAAATAATPGEFSNALILDNVPAGSVRRLQVFLRAGDESLSNRDSIAVQFALRITNATNRQAWEYLPPGEIYRAEPIVIPVQPQTTPDDTTDPSLERAVAMLADLSFTRGTPEASIKAEIQRIRAQLPPGTIADPDRWLWARGVPGRYLTNPPAEDEIWKTLAENAETSNWQRLRSLRSGPTQTEVEIWRNAWIDWRLGAGPKPSAPPPNANVTADRWNLLLGIPNPALVATYEKFAAVDDVADVLTGRTTRTLDVAKVADQTRAQPLGNFAAAPPTGSGSGLLTDIQRWKSARISGRQLGTIQTAGTDAALTLVQNEIMIDGGPGFLGGVYEFYGAPGNWRCMILRAAPNGSAYRLEDAPVSSFNATLQSPDSAVLVCPPPNMSDADYEQLRSAITASRGEVTIAPCIAALGTRAGQNQWDNDAIALYFYLVNPKLAEMSTTNRIRKYSR